jgi:uncharacterized membrane protein
MQLIGEVIVLKNLKKQSTEIKGYSNLSRRWRYEEVWLVLIIRRAWTALIQDGWV